MKNIIAANWFGVTDSFGKDITTFDGIKLEALNFVSGIIGFLGVVFVCLFIYGAVTWMTAQADAEKVKKAQGIITSAFAGLLVIILARVIIGFVIRLVLPT
jgi:hypothetical protein